MKVQEVQRASSTGSAISRVQIGMKCVDNNEAKEACKTKEARSGSDLLYGGIQRKVKVDRTA